MLVGRDIFSRKRTFKRLLVALLQITSHIKRSARSKWLCSFIGKPEDAQELLNSKEKSKIFTFDLAMLKSVLGC